MIHLLVNCYYQLADSLGRTELINTPRAIRYKLIELFARSYLKSYSSDHLGHSFRGSGGFDPCGIAQVGVDVMLYSLYPFVDLVK